ncbi:MAG: type III-A CRISPR-associated protein Csm2 [Spirochaetales bacterium]|nr:type III-A CRISPR-associated protein Csm2 [Spirochaetales bacterium]
MNQHNKKQPLEEARYYEWNLKTGESIYKKIFEEYTDTSQLKDLLDGERLVVFAYALGRVASQAGLKITQIRRFYESILIIKAKLTIKKSSFKKGEDFKTMIPDILNLKPLLAYTQARHTRQLEPFFIIVNPLLDTIRDSVDFDKFIQFIEAVVAYHKYCGGRD